MEHAVVDFVSYWLGKLQETEGSRRKVTSLGYPRIRTKYHLLSTLAI